MSTPRSITPHLRQHLHRNQSREQEPSDKPIAYLGFTPSTPTGSAPSSHDGEGGECLSERLVFWTLAFARHVKNGRARGPGVRCSLDTAARSFMSLPCVDRIESNSGKLEKTICYLSIPVANTYGSDRLVLNLLRSQRSFCVSRPLHPN